MNADHTRMVYVQRYHRNFRLLTASPRMSLERRPNPENPSAVQHTFPIQSNTPLFQFSTLLFPSNTLLFQFSTLLFQSNFCLSRNKIKKNIKKKKHRSPLDPRASFTPSSGPAWILLSPFLWTSLAPSSRPLRSWRSCGRRRWLPMAVPRRVESSCRRT